MQGESGFSIVVQPFPLPRWGRQPMLAHQLARLDDRGNVRRHHNEFVPAAQISAAGIADPHRQPKLRKIPKECTSFQG